MTQVLLSSPTFVTLSLERGRVLSLVPGVSAVLTVAIPGESVAQPVAASASFGPYEQRREATLNLSLGTAVYEVLESAAGGGEELTADAIADTLETAPPADLARIQSSVSGYYAAFNYSHLLAPSGAFTGVSGQFTLGTAIGAIPNGSVPGGGNCMMYLPVGAGGLAAGWYAATFTSTTVGTLVGSPATTATAWTAGTSSVTMPPLTIPANAMGANGVARALSIGRCNNSATAKSFRAGIGATGGGISTGAWSAQNTTNNGARQEQVIIARTPTKQILGVESGFVAAGLMQNYTTVDTMGAWDLTPSLQVAAATDWAMYEHVSILVTYRG